MAPLLSLMIYIRERQGQRIHPFFRLFNYAESAVGANLAWQQIRHIYFLIPLHLIRIPHLLTPGSRPARADSCS